jgi:hypothetical protein
VVEGQADDFSRTFLGTPWSAPLRFDVLSDFQRKTSAINRRAAPRPTFEVTAQFAAASAGGRALSSSSASSAASGRLPVQEARDLQGTFDAKGIASSASSAPQDRLLRGDGHDSAARTSCRPGPDPFFIPLARRARSIRFVRACGLPALLRQPARPRVERAHARRRQGHPVAVGPAARSRAAGAAADGAGDTRRRFRRWSPPPASGAPPHTM